MRVGKWIGRILTTIIILCVIAAGAGWYVLNHYSNKIDKVDVFANLDADTRPDLPAPLPDAPAIQETQNILLVGSDARNGPNSRYGTEEGARADTTILIHIPANSTEATFVSIPRDSYVTIPSCTKADGSVTQEKEGKFNSAYAVGGPTCAVKTVEHLSGIFINHYIEVDFTGVINIVDALGGVDVYLPEAVNDKDSELNLPAGISHVNGEQALAFVRARKFDPTGDIGRIGRQQQLLSTMLKEAKSNNILLDGNKVKNFLDTATEAVTTDPDLTVNKMLSLFQATNGLNLEQVQFVTPPIDNINYQKNGVSYVQLNAEKTAALFEAVKTDMPLPEGTTILNGAENLPSTQPAPTP